MADTDRPAAEKPRLLRMFAGLLPMLPPLIFLFIAYWISWPLGPDYKDEGGITTLRLALASLIMGLIFALVFTGNWLLALVRNSQQRLERIEQLLEEMRKEQRHSEGSGK